jgi:2-dehydro-3-deoxyphosphooctonate aldolase (KDO 8-P synthase)
MRGLGVPVIFDDTHTLRLPGGFGTAFSGQRQFGVPLVGAGLAAGCDGLFLEFRPDPDRAPSDGPTVLSPDAPPSLLADVSAIAPTLAQPA